VYGVPRYIYVTEINGLHLKSKINHCIHSYGKIQVNQPLFLRIVLYYIFIGNFIIWEIEIIVFKQFTRHVKPVPRMVFTLHGINKISINIFKLHCIWIINCEITLNFDSFCD